VTSSTIESSSSATKTIGVDTVTVHPPSGSASPSPAPSTNDGDTTEEQDNEDIENQEKGIVGFWDWLKGKVGNLWDKVTGSKTDSDSGSASS